MKKAEAMCVFLFLKVHICLTMFREVHQFYFSFLHLIKLFQVAEFYSVKKKKM